MKLYSWAYDEEVTYVDLWQWCNTNRNTLLRISVGMIVLGYALQFVHENFLEPWCCEQSDNTVLYDDFKSSNT